MTHARKYGDRESHPLPLWNGILEHRRRIGDALWEFVWCLDRITAERDGVGIVLGGTPVKLAAIATDLELPKETVRRHLERLEKGAYIRMRRTPYGHAIEVQRSQKFRIWQKEKPQNAVSPAERNTDFGSEKPIGGSEKPKIVVSKEDAAVTQQKDTAVRRPPVWDFLGVDGSSFSSQVREVCSGLYRSKNGQSPVEFIGSCMDGIQALKLRIPPALAHRASELRTKPRAKPLPELEAIPWAR